MYLVFGIVTMLLVLFVAVALTVKVIQIDPVNRCSYDGPFSGASTAIGFNSDDVVREYVPIWMVQQRKNELKNESKCYLIDYWWVPNRL